MTTSFAHDSPELAETYDRLSDSQFEGGKRLVDGLKIGPGHRVLDVGCGTGRLAHWIGQRVGPTGSVVGIDPLPERIAVARTRADGVAFEVGQAEDLSAFGDATFDAVCMSAVFHWVADKPKALVEVRRVLRPGGCLGVTTLSSELMHAGTVAEVLRPILERPAYASRVDLSALAIANPEQTTTALVSMVIDSGLHLAQLSIVARSRAHPSGADVLAFLESSSFGNFLRIVPEELRGPLRVDLAVAFDARKGIEGIVLRDWGTWFVAKRAS